METQQEWNTPNWYLIRTHPRQESRVESNLKVLNLQTFVPMYRNRVQNQYTGHVCYVPKPLFPGYIFAHFKINDLYHKVNYTRGVHSLVSFSNKPATVDDEVIAMIQSRAGNDGLVRIEEDLTPGDQVVVKQGPFKNLTAVFERTMSGADRVLLLLQIVNYQAHIIVDRQSVKLAARDGSACPQ